MMVDDWRWRRRREEEEVDECEVVDDEFENTEPVGFQWMNLPC